MKNKKNVEKKETHKRDFLWWALRVSFCGMIILLLVSFLVEIFVPYQGNSYKYYDYQSNVLNLVCLFSLSSISFSIISLMKKKLIRMKDWLFPTIILISSVIAFIYAYLWGMSYGVAG